MDNIKIIAIAGAGTMGASIAETFAKYNYKVILYDVNKNALENAKQLIGINQITEVSERGISKEKSSDIISNILYTDDEKELQHGDIIIEAIIENIDAKKAFWARVSESAKENAILASNTSGLSITQIAENIGKPENFLGMHWINPPHIIPLIEIVKGERTSESIVKEIYDVCLRIDKKPVIVKDSPGFVLNRIQLAVLRECLYIAQRGIASVEDIDNVMKYALGIRYACLGPFEVADHGGLDVFQNIAQYLFKDLSNENESFYLLKESVENGYLGIKSGKGFYDYSNGKKEEAIIYRDKMYTKISKCLFE